VICSELRQIALRRLHTQQIARTHFKQPGALLTWLGAIQGQDYAGTKWTLGLRLPGSKDADIERALAGKAIVRSWILRGTLHFAAAEDLRWMIELVAERLISGSARRYRELELDEKTLVRSNDLLVKSLQGGQRRTRPELFAMLEQNGISTLGQRGVHLLQRASLDGLICQGETQRNQPTFFALEELPAASTLSRDEALAELARRYFTSRGPATLQDFVWWSGLSTADARAGLDAVQEQLLQEVVEGQTYYCSPATPAVQDTSPAAYLLPGFDEYLLAYKDRRAVLDDPLYQRKTPTNGMLPATIVIDGKVTGTWRRAFKKETVSLQANPFRELNKEEQAALVAAGKRYAVFLGMKSAE
jgi:hypothetical protein